MENIKIYAFADEADPNVDGQITAMKRNGLSGLEIRGVDGQNVSDITLKKAKEVRAKLDANGLVTWSVGSPIGKIELDGDFEAHIEKFKHTLEIANILGAKNMRIFSFYIPQGVDADDCKDEVIERLSRFVEISDGITLCHENEKGIYGDIADRCVQIHKALSGIKAVFDPANFIQCGQDTLQAWSKLKGYVHYMHIKDANEYKFIVPAGEGIGNIKAIANDFIKNGGSNFTIEPHLSVFTGLEELEREGDTTKMKFKYPNRTTAFDTACNAFKEVIL